ncbi:MAG: pilus assembly FimT family protein [Patescibacteria group bacterium]
MNSKGFSIVELIVTMAIVGIISTIVFANYKQMGRQTFLDNQADAIVSYIEEARSTALSATKVTNQETGNQVDYFTVDVEEDRIILFKGTDKQKVYLLENQVEIKEGVGYKIGFQSPEPDVSFWNNADELIDHNRIEIVVNYKSEEEDDIIIKINKAGLIWTSRQ